MKIHWIQHVPFESLGIIEQWTYDRSHTLSSTKVYENTVFPDINTFDWLIIMGGPMGANDHHEYPWLIAEKTFMSKAIDAGKTVIGICLGAQIIASVLGARVYKNKYKEIGWLPVQFTPDALKCPVFKDFPQTTQVFQWHGDTFDMPQNSLHVAYSNACANQSFIYNNKVIGLQFHCEMTEQNILDILVDCADELVDAPYIQSKPDIFDNIPELVKHNNTLMYTLLDNIYKSNIQ